MKKFSYDFHSVLQLKEYDEEFAKMEFARANVECEKLKNTIQNNDNIRNKLAKSYNYKGDFSSMIHYSGFLKNLNFDNVNKNKELLEKQKIAKEKLEEYKKVFVKAEIFRKHKENNKKLWYKDTLKKENEISDDIAGIFYVRKMPDNYMEG